MRNELRLILALAAAAGLAASAAHAAPTDAQPNPDQTPPKAGKHSGYHHKHATGNHAKPAAHQPGAMEQPKNEAGSGAPAK